MKIASVSFTTVVAVGRNPNVFSPKTHAQESLSHFKDWDGNARDAPLFSDEDQPPRIPTVTDDLSFFPASGITTNFMNEQKIGVDSAQISGDVVQLPMPVNAGSFALRKLAAKSMAVKPSKQKLAEAREARRQGQPLPTPVKKSEKVPVKIQKAIKNAVEQAAIEKFQDDGTFIENSVQ